MSSYRLNYLAQLESESIYIIREAIAEFKNPVMLYSIGKDSSVLLHLARKAVYPGTIPFPLLHIDTGYKFREMIEFRDYFTNKIGARLIINRSEETSAQAMRPEQANTEEYIYLKKTKPLLEAIKKYGFDAAFGGARRDEEKSRAKERVFSIRGENGVWDPKAQRLEVWHNYNTCLSVNQTMRIFPLSNWTELDIWRYIKQEGIEIVPLYFAKKREIVMRNGMYFQIDEFVKPEKNEKITELVCRYRTLGCSPSTGAVLSSAASLDEIIVELEMAKSSERSNRAIDTASSHSMEKKKKEGYF